MLEKTLESPLDSKEIQPVHPKQNHLFEDLGFFETTWLGFCHSLKNISNWAVQQADKIRADDSATDKMAATLSASHQKIFSFLWFKVKSLNLKC